MCLRKIIGQYVKENSGDDKNSKITVNTNSVEFQRCKLHEHLQVVFQPRNSREVYFIPTVWFKELKNLQNHNLHPCFL